MPEPSTFGHPDDSEARLPILLVERTPEPRTDRSIRHNLAVRANTVDGERHAGERANPRTTGAAITDDGIGSRTNIVVNRSRIRRTSVEGNGGRPAAKHAMPNTMASDAT